MSEKRYGDLKVEQEPIFDKRQKWVIDNILELLEEHKRDILELNRRITQLENKK